MNLAEAAPQEWRHHLVLYQDPGYGESSQLTDSLEEVSRMPGACAPPFKASGAMRGQTTACPGGPRQDAGAKPLAGC